VAEARPPSRANKQTDHDPAVIDIDAWADYWHSAQVDIVSVSVTGILAFYFSKVPTIASATFSMGPTSSANASRF
jgi:hypothetical protein